MNHCGFAYLQYIIRNPLLCIKNQEIKVSNDCFLAAVLYSKTKSEKRDSVFKDNFIKSFRKLLPCEYSCIKINDIDFQRLESIVLQCKKIPQQYGKVVINNITYKLNNYIVEPLHIFKGRGDHPQRGIIKFPVMPEQITLNVSKTPECMLKNHTWGNIINNPQIHWAGFYKDCLGNSKYMYPIYNDECKKFDNARKLKKKLYSIRKCINEDISSENIRIAQKATAAYLIDKLCIRVGHPKESDCADTVGCCTLRVEHVKISKNSINFSFLGKDSIEYNKTFCPHENIISNMLKFIKNKKQCELIFHMIDATSLNNYLDKLCNGLTAKQFRTCHASDKFETLLKYYNPAIDGNVLKYYRQCNKKVAKLCNHKRGNSLSNETSKANYIDPRIVFAFSLRHKIPINQLYSDALIEKHSWAKNTSVEFKF